jgi:hypothetical protein
MTDTDDQRNDRARSAVVLSYVSVGIWAVSLVAMVFLMQHCPSAKRFYPILAGGSAVGIVLIATIAKSR